MRTIQGVLHFSRTLKTKLTLNKTTLHSSEEEVLLYLGKLFRQEFSTPDDFFSWYNDQPKQGYKIFWWGDDLPESRSYMFTAAAAVDKNNVIDAKIFNSFDQAGLLEFLGGLTGESFATVDAFIAWNKIKRPIKIYLTQHLELDDHTLLD